MKKLFTIVPQFLKDPKVFYESVQRNEDLKEKAGALFLSTLVFLMIYGLITGFVHSWMQGLSTMVKMPMLFLLTLLFTLPALYFFSLALLNVRFSVGQAVVVVLAGISVSAFLLLGLAPVTLFFVLTSTNYPFFQLLAVVFVGISGFTGLTYVLKGMQWVDTEGTMSSSRIGRVLLWGWVVLFGFVGAQMTWRLSPFIGEPGTPFYMVRPSRDNFFVDVMTALSRAFGLETRANSDWGFGAVCIGIFVILAIVVIVAFVNKSSKKTPSDLTEIPPLPGKE
jgi:hypothetical protein